MTSNSEPNRVSARDDKITAPSLSLESKIPSRLEMKKRVDEEAVNALKNLSKLSEGELFDKRKLQASLEAELKSILMLDINKITEIYKQSTTSAEKANLEKIFELLNVKSDAEKAKQREINVVIDMIKLDLDTLEGGVVGKLIQERYNEGKYQEAIDIAVVFSQKDPFGAFGGIIRILKEMKKSGSTETLMIKDKRITPSQRDRRIRKMEDNMQDAIAQFNREYFGDVRNVQTDQFELNDTKKTKTVSEKKALQEINKELADILKHLNEGSAFTFVDATYEDIKTKTQGKKGGIDQVVTREYLLSNNYIPKNGKEIRNREINAIKNLFLFRWNYFDGPGKSQDTKFSSEGKEAYTKISSAKIAGVQLNEVRQANEVIGMIKMNETNVSNSIKILLADANRDGTVRVASAINRKREGVDQGTLFGGQIVKMYENALIRVGEEQLVKNIEAVIKELRGQSGFEISPKNQEGLFDALTANPAALIAFRKKLFSEPDSGMHMLYLGKDYASVKVDEIKRSNETKRQLEAFLKTPDGLKQEEKYTNALKDKQNSALEVSYQNLLKIQGNEKFFKKLTQKEQKEIEDLIKMLEPTKRSEFLDSDQMKAQRKEFFVSGVGVGLSAIGYHGETNYGAGAGLSMSSNTINEALQKTGFLNSASASLGLYGDKSGLKLGIGLSTSGSQETSVSSRLFYGAGVGWSPLRPSQIGLNVPVGHEWQINQKELENSLDRKPGKYIGAVGAFGVGINLSDPSLDIISLSAQVYGRRDKLEGIQQQTEHIKRKMAPIFQEIFGSQIVSDSMQVINETIETNTLAFSPNPDTIAKKLQAKFPDTKGETISQMAIGMYNTFTFYKDSGVDVIGELSKDFAEYVAQNFRNQNIEEIIDEGWHLSQVGVGATLSLSRFFTGRFITGSLAMTKYDDASYEQDQVSLQRAIDGMNNINNFSVINKAKNLSGKIGLINQLLGKECIKEQSDLINKTTGIKTPGFLILEESAFSPDMKVFCHPKLAPYMHIENGIIKLPHNADISLGKILHQGKETRTLILGAQSANGCSEIEYTEKIEGAGKKLSWKSDQEKTAFGVNPFDTYNTKEVQTASTVDVVLDGKPNQKLADYLESNGDALVNFRFQKKAYDAFINYIKSNPQRDDKFVAGALALLPDTIKNLKDDGGNVLKFTADDIRFIYASLSRVSQTRDKQLEGEDLKNKANSYLDAIRSLSPAQKTELKGYIKKVEVGTALNDGEWSAMKSMLKIPQGWHYYNISTPEGKLFHILTPIKKLAEARTSEYERKIRAEYSSTPAGAAALIQARKESLLKLDGKATAKGALLTEYIGAVAGYDDASQINDKFVGAPKMVAGDLVDIKGDGLVDVKKHYLTELARDDVAQFISFKDKIITALEQSNLKDDKQLVETLKKKESTDFISWVVENSEKVHIDMKYGFFADCVNETILLGNVKVNITKITQVPQPNEVYYYEAAVTNNRVTVIRNVGIGVMAGEVRDNDKGPRGNTNLEVEPGGKTEPLADLDDLNAENIKVVDGTNVEIDGVTYTYQYVEMPDGNEGVVVYNGNDIYQVFSDGNRVTLHPLDDNGNAIIPNNNNTKPVDGINVIPESSEKGSSPSASGALIQLLHILKSSESSKERIRLKNK